MDLIRELVFALGEPAEDIIKKYEGYLQYDCMGVAYCSVCGARMKTPGYTGTKEWHEQVYKYCPSCGGKLGRSYIEAD